MKKLVLCVRVVALAGRRRRVRQRQRGLEIKPGSTVTVEKKDGVIVAGRLVEVKPEHVVVETRDRRHWTSCATCEHFVAARRETRPRRRPPAGSTGRAGGLPPDRAGGRGRRPAADAIPASDPAPPRNIAR